MNDSVIHRRGRAIAKALYMYLAIAAANSGERARRDSRSWAVKVLEMLREVSLAMAVGNATVSSDTIVGFVATVATEIAGAFAICRWINAFRAFAANSDCALLSKLSEERTGPGVATITAADTAIAAAPHIQNLFIRSPFSVHLPREVALPFRARCDVAHLCASTSRGPPPRRIQAPQKRFTAPV